MGTKHLTAGSVATTTRAAPNPHEKFGSGRFVSGTNSSFLIQDNAFDIIGDLSLTIIFDMDTVSGSNGNLPFLGFYSTDNIDDTILTPWGLNINISGLGNDNKLRWRQAGGQVSPATGSTILSTGYHTITIQRDSIAKTFKLYLDGALELDSTYTGTLTGGTGSSLCVGGNTSRAAVRDTAWYEVRIWDKVVPQEILDQIVSDEGISEPLGDELAFYSFEDRYVDPNEYNWWEEQSGNGLHFQKNANFDANNTVGVACPEPKWGSGVRRNIINAASANVFIDDINGDLDIEGDLSLFLVFHADAEHTLVNNPSIMLTSAEKTDTNPSDYTFRCDYMRPTTGPSYFRFSQGGTTPSNFGNSAIAIPADGAVHTATVVREGSNVTVYVDGVESANAAFTGAVVSGVTTHNMLSTFQRHTASNNNGFQGAFYELRVWDKAIPQSVLNELADPNSGISAPLGDEVFHWRAREEIVDPKRLNWWQDSSKNKKYLEQGSVATTDVAPLVGYEKFGRGRGFTKVVGKYLSIYDSDFYITDALSLTIAFYFAGLDLPTDNATLVYYGTANNPFGAEPTWVLGMNANNLQFRQKGEPTVSIANPVSVGNHTITIQRDITGNTLKIYLDGSLVIDTTVDPTTAIDSGAALLIGGSEGNDTTMWQGSIHELRIWDKVIDQAILDDIVDPNSDGPYEEGTELLFWRAEDIEYGDFY